MNNCPYCNKSFGNNWPWIPTCCVEGYFMLPFDDLSDDDITEAAHYMQKSQEKFE